MNNICPLVKNKETVMKQLKTASFIDKLFALTEEDFKSSNIKNIFENLVKNDAEFNYGNLKIKISNSIFSTTGVVGFALDNQKGFVLDSLNYFNNLQFKKCLILITYFHELTHIKQFSQFNINTDYYKLMLCEDYGVSKKCNPKYEFCLLETDAKFHSITKYFNLIQEQDLSDCAETWLVLMQQCYHYMLAAMNIPFENTLFTDGIVSLNSFKFAKAFNKTPNNIKVVKEFKKYVDYIQYKFNVNFNIDFNNVSTEMQKQAQQVSEIFSICCKNLAMHLKDLKNVCKTAGINLNHLYNANLTIKEITSLFESIIFILFNSKTVPVNVKNIAECEELMIN